MTGEPGPCGCGCALTEDTSDGFDVAWFAEHVVGEPLDEWERHAAIHGLELLPDGRPRFRILLIIVARQNGKTTLCRILTLFWLFVLRVSLVLGIANSLGNAQVQWEKVLGMIRANTDLTEDLNKVRFQPGQAVIATVGGSEYRYAAPNSDAGRSLSVSRLLVDELRTHKTYDCWTAATYAMNAMPYGQAVCITNQGDDSSVVLNKLRDSAIKFIETGDGDQRLGLLEWSAPEGSDPTDLHAVAMANPNMGRYHANGQLALHPDDLIGPGAQAKQAGGEALAKHLTEVLCVRVPQLSPALDGVAWEACHVPGSLDDVRSRVVLCVDVAPSNLHATVYAAAVLEDGRTRIDFVQEWIGTGCTNRLRNDLPGLIRKVKPRAVGWLPNGPAAALAADMAQRPGWPPAGVLLTEVKSDLPAVCMGFAEQVSSKRIVHSADPLLDKQVETAEKYERGNVWVFSRKGGPCDALYAAAGAVHLARTLPPPVGKPRLVVAK